MLLCASSLLHKLPCFFMICPRLSQTMGRGIASIPASTRTPVRGNDHWQRALERTLKDHWQRRLLGATAPRLLQLGLPADHQGYKGEEMGNLSKDLLIMKFHMSWHWALDFLCVHVRKFEPHFCCF